jgi:hypothetical protein
MITGLKIPLPRRSQVITTPWARPSRPSVFRLLRERAGYRLIAMTTTAPVLGPGTRLGAYEIVMLLGTGGMGAVYKARDTVIRLRAPHQTT